MQCRCWAVEDGVFSLTQEEGVGARWCEAYVGPDDLTDYVIEFDIVQAIDGGIYFRLSNGENGLNTYMLGSDGINIYFAKVVDGVFGVMSAPEQQVEGGKRFATAYTQMWDAHWKLVVKGNVFSAYVLGSEEPIIQATDSDFASGRIGFNYNAPLEGEPSMEITNFQLYTVDESIVEQPDDPTEPENTEIPEKTDPTEAPATNPSEPADNQADPATPTGLIIGIVIAVVVIALGVVVVVKRKKS